MPKPRIRERIANAVDAWSQKRVTAVKQRARKASWNVRTARSGFALATVGDAPGSILFASSQVGSAQRKAANASARAKRVEARHTTGFIGRLKKRIRGT